jgi:hypothetical protein
VVWFFERQGRFIRFETRDASDQPGVFELVIIDPNGGERVEQFPSSELLVRRQEELQHHLVSNGWQGPHGRFI